MVARNNQWIHSVSQYATITAATIVAAFNPITMDLLDLSGYRRYSLMIDAYAVLLILLYAAYRRTSLSQLGKLILVVIVLFPVYGFAVELWLAHRQLSRDKPATRIERTHQRDAALGWAPVPNAVGTHAVAGNFDVEYRFDELGRKEIDQSPNVERTIHVFGDSYIFGHGVSNDDTALNLLAERLRGIVNIQNYAVMGYGLEQIYVRLEQNRKQIDSDDLVLFITTASSMARNVIDRRYVCEVYFTGRLRRSLRIDGTKTSWVNLEHECNYVRDVLLRRSRLPFSALYQWYHDLASKEDLTRNVDSILSMAKNLVSRRGADFHFLLMARPNECLAGHHDTDWSSLVTSFDTLLTFCPNDEAETEGFSFPTEGHLNAAGNAWIAEALGEYLTRRGMVGNLPAQ